MTSLAQFRSMVPCGDTIALYRMLDLAAAERGATPDTGEDYFRFSPYHYARLLIGRLCEKLANIVPSFLIDPSEICLNAMRNKSIRCHDLVSLAEAAGGDFLPPIAAGWTDSPVYSVYHYAWPHSPENLTVSTHTRPRLRRRLDGAYFIQAAEIMAQLRYYAPVPLQTSITIPACAAGNTVSHIYAIYINGLSFDESTDFYFSRVWDQYLAPGRYYRNFFNLPIEDDFPAVVFAGYVDLQNNLQYFSS